MKLSYEIVEPIKKAELTVKVDEELIVLADPTIQTWLDSSKKDITWTHWNAYEKMLKKQAGHRERGSPKI